MLTELQLLRLVNGYIDYCCLAGYLIGCLVYKKYRPLRSITFLLLLTLVSDQIVAYCGLYFRNTSRVYHFFNPLQLLMLSIFFYSNFENTIVKKTVPYVTALALVWGVVNTIFFQGFPVNPTNFILVETLLLIIWATVLFIEKLDLPASENIFQDPVFITVSGILCFNIFSFIYFLLANYFTTHRISQFNSIYKILYFANFIYYALLVTATIFSFRKVNYHAKIRR